MNEVEAVSIAVPTALHYKAAKDCLEAGVHVLVEKPMALTLAEADRIKLSDKLSMHDQPMIVVWKQVGEEVFRCVFEVRPGKKNRALALWSLVVKLS